MPPAAPLPAEAQEQCPAYPHVGAWGSWEVMGHITTRGKERGIGLVGTVGTYCHPDRSPCFANAKQGRSRRIGCKMAPPAAWQGVLFSTLLRPTMPDHASTIRRLFRASASAS